MLIINLSRGLSMFSSVSAILNSKDKEAETKSIAEKILPITQAIANNKTHRALKILNQSPDILVEMLKENSDHQNEFFKMLNPTLRSDTFSFSNYLKTLRKLPRNET